jgi:predicted nucleic-acid-binding Zn-ribbon protein
MHDGSHDAGPNGRPEQRVWDRIVCRRCDTTEVLLCWQRFADGTRHIRVTCRRCGRFVRYAAQTSENVACADAAAADGVAP